MARTDPQVNIRMPADLKDRIEKAAPESNRSMNAEIVHRLESSFYAAADQSRLEYLLADLQERHNALLAEYTLFLNADHELRGLLRKLTKRYGVEIVRMAFNELSARQAEQVRVALAEQDHAWAGKVMADAITSVENRLKDRNQEMPDSW